VLRARKRARGGRSVAAHKKATRKKATRKKATRRKATRQRRRLEEGEVLSPTELLERAIVEKIADRPDPLMKGTRHVGGYYGIRVVAMDGAIRVTIHNYVSQVARMSKYLQALGYCLRGVIKTDFEMTRDGREFWWVKGR
jgi:hypothetical protein